MTDKPELLPCPHCGKSAGIITHANAHQVICGDRKCSVYKYHDKKEDAIEAWNTRAPFPVTKEAAQEMLKHIDFQDGGDLLDWWASYHMKVRALLEAAAKGGE